MMARLQDEGRLLAIVLYIIQELESSGFMTTA